MSLRFRIGPFTIGTSGVRLSVWKSGSGISVPLTGEDNSFGKVKVGPASVHLNGGKKGKEWKNDPATERQKQYANSLGIKYSNDVSKGQLSDLISRARAKKAG